MKFLSSHSLVLVGTIGCTFVAYACSATPVSSSGSPSGSMGGGNSSSAGGSGPNFNASQGGTGVVGGGASVLQADGLHLLGRIRDFHYDFPDMEPGDHSSSKHNDSGHSEQNPTPSDPNMNCGANSIYPNSCFVGTTIGSDSKPVYVGPDTGTVTTTGPDNFAWWFKSDPDKQINMEEDLEFILSDNGNGTYTYSNNAYFPIDGLLFGNEGQADALGNQHNYGFTTEFHMKFTYSSGQTFYFKGDDDLIVFIDGKLAVDRSGIHNAQEAYLNLDDLGLNAGQSYQFDLFYCERHRTLSDLTITTSMEFTAPVQIN